jgi:nucleotide-binding universal stress UspA family protein
MTEPADPVVVPGDPLATGGRIVVGVDDSAHANVALLWALREAVLRQAAVEVVHAWQPPLASLPFGATLPLSVDEGEIDAAARAELDQLVDAALAEQGEPSPEVTRTTLPGAAGPTLIDIARDADLLVVGSHGRTGLARLMLGSVAHACVEHASCPVVVIRLHDGSSRD